jgi:hypothetical protein
MDTDEDTMHYIKCKYTESYIKYYKKIVPDDLCSKMCRYNFNYEASTYSTHASGKVLKEDRVNMDACWISKNNWFYEPIKECFENVIVKYKAEFPLFEVSKTTDFRISRYDTGGFMSSHVDNIHHSHGQEWGYPQVSALLYLNDDYEGGEFIVGGKTFQTEKGSALIFPSNFIYPHEVKEIIRGARWSVVTWLM